MSRLSFTGSFCLCSDSLYIDNEERNGGSHHISRERLRFEWRILEWEHILFPFLQPSHRTKVILSQTKEVERRTHRDTRCRREADMPLIVPSYRIHNSLIFTYNFILGVYNDYWWNHFIYHYKKINLCLWKLYHDLSLFF